MKHRKLRIAFSAVCGVLCLLLIALCVRSYHHDDTLYVRVLGIRVVQFNSAIGHFVIESPSSAIQLRRHPSYWHFMTRPIAPLDEAMSQRRFSPPMFLISLTLASPGILMPFWIPLLVLGLMAGMPWIAWRFSLRTLLIATTVVAVGLGLIVYAAS
jgi:hypothetical protein